MASALVRDDQRHHHRHRLPRDIAGTLSGHIGDNTFGPQPPRRPGGSDGLSDRLALSHAGGLVAYLFAGRVLEFCFDLIEPRLWIEVDGDSYDPMHSG